MTYKKTYGRQRLLLAVSQRKDGSMGLSVDFYASESIGNRSRFFQAAGINPGRVVHCNQVHGKKVAAVKRVRNRLFPETDALVTDKPNIFLAVRHADCFPVFFYDASLRSVGVAHSGWRGTAKGIIPGVVRALRKYYSVLPQNIYARVGPGIQKCHFEVWPKGRHKGITPFLKKYPEFTKRKNGRVFVNLSGIIRFQLLASGLLEEHVKVSKDCTYHMPRKYFSYRRDRSAKNPRGFGNMISVIGSQMYESC